MIIVTMDRSRIPSSGGSIGEHGGVIDSIDN